MGVPAFFRWLSRKFPSIVVHCVEEKAQVVDGVKAPIDSSKPNPNEVEFDNLYLDMNGIIHPCCHPEDKPAPANEDEMMVLIFEYIDRIFAICRPRRLLYMAIDGVAPRAKMNQQRSRRFRAAKEGEERRSDISRIKEEILARGGTLPKDEAKREHFDSNCITPGTPFMHKLAKCLRYYVHDRLNNDPGWKNIQVILSDANCPGEGEHKIMDFIRKQRNNPDHDPNTHHCLCGADADLIHLGLATHEPYFTIIREEFKPNTPKPCDICKQLGHDPKDCLGLPKDFDEDNVKPIEGNTSFIWIRITVLREYLTRELALTNLPFDYTIERAIDDWVFLCFFVGNDFLPHLPSLEIREGAIDRLVNIYKKIIYKVGGYLTDSGEVNMAATAMVLSAIGEVEDEIFKSRQKDEMDFKRRNKEKKKRIKREEEMRNGGPVGKPAWMMTGQYAPKALVGGSGGGGNVVESPRETAAELRKATESGTTAGSSSNANAAADLRAMLKGDKASPSNEKKRAHNSDSDSEDEPLDEVRLYEDGWKDRYYTSKFEVEPTDVEFRHKVARHYVRGMCWVLRYYFQGCASWKWYFPYHYAPFASDFVGIADLVVEFEKNTQPFKPMEQLMAVFPAASGKHVPSTFEPLMREPESSIIDFYPIDFKVDLNGKKYAWMGVALLPFVDETRLFKALAKVYPLLTAAEKYRNTRGSDKLFVGKHHPAFQQLKQIYKYSRNDGKKSYDVSLTKGLAGLIWPDEDNFVDENAVVPSPIPAHLEPLPDNASLIINFEDPKYEDGFLFPARLLPNVKMPAPTLKTHDFPTGNFGTSGKQVFHSGSSGNGQRRCTEANSPSQDSYSPSQARYSSHGMSQARYDSPSPGNYISPSNGKYGSPSRGNYGSPSRGYYSSPSLGYSRSPSQAVYSSPEYGSPGGFRRTFGFDDSLGSPFNRSVGSPGFYHFPIGSPFGSRQPNWREDSNNNVRSPRSRLNEEASASPNLKRSARKAPSFDENTRKGKSSSSISKSVSDSSPGSGNFSSVSQDSSSDVPKYNPNALQRPPQDCSSLPSCKRRKSDFC